MDDILAKKNRHLFLEEKDNQNNSFIRNINYAVENIDTIKTFNDNVNSGTMQHLLETYIEQVGTEGNAWVVKLTELGESILATTSGFNYATVFTANQDIAAEATITLPEAIKYRVGTHMLLVSWNGTVCYNGEQYEEVGAFNEKSTVIKIKQAIKTGDKLEFRTVALADTASVSLALGDAITSYTFPINSSNTERTLAERFSDIINVKDYGVKGDGTTDDTEAVQAAVNETGVIFFPKGTYSLTGKISVGSNTLLLVASGTSFILDCSGDDGRGFCFQECHNSGICGNFTIYAHADSLTTYSDGGMNACIWFGCKQAVESPNPTRMCFCKGNIDIKISGTNNVKAVYLSGWVEDFVCEGVSVTGKTNYAIGCHWTSNNFPNLPTKTWHAHNLVFKRCKIFKDDAYSKPLRGLFVSAPGHVIFEDCDVDTTTLCYSLFAGDYGYTYAQNIEEEEQFCVDIRGGKVSGTGPFSVDCVTAGVNDSAVWKGNEHNARLLVDGLSFNASEMNGASDICVAVTGLMSFILKNVRLFSKTENATKEFLYAQQCKNIVIDSCDFKHNKHARFETSDNVVLSSSFFHRTTPTPYVTSYCVTMSGIKNALISGNYFYNTRTGLYSTDNNSKAFVIVGNMFKGIGAACISVSYTKNIVVNGNEIIGCGTAAVPIDESTSGSVNIYGIVLASVTGFAVYGNVFQDSLYRYNVNIDANSANGSIFGNCFLSLNPSENATNKAAVFKNASAQNVLVDTNTNVTGSGISLVYPS